MKRMKRIVCAVCLVYCIACVAVVEFSGYGFFLSIGEFATIRGGHLSVLDKIVAHSLDIVSAPLQVTILWPCSAIMLAYENTGERKAKREEAEKVRESTQRYIDLLDNDAESMFTLPDFQTPSNCAAMAAIDEWVYSRKGDRKWCAEFLPRCAEHVLSHSELMPEVGNLWRIHKLDVSVQVRGLQEAARLAETGKFSDAKMRLLLENIMGRPETGESCGIVPEEVVVQYVDHPNRLVSRCARNELGSRWYYSGYPEGWDKQHPND